MQPVLSSVLLRGLGALAGDPEIASVVTDSREAGPGFLTRCFSFISDLLTKLMVLRAKKFSFFIKN